MTEEQVVLTIDDSKQPECDSYVRVPCPKCHIQQRFRVDPETNHIISGCAYCDFKHGIHDPNLSYIRVERKKTTVLTRFQGVR